MTKTYSIKTISIKTVIGTIPLLLASTAYAQQGQYIQQPPQHHYYQGQNFHNSLSQDQRYNFNAQPTHDPRPYSLKRFEERHDLYYQNTGHPREHQNYAHPFEPADKPRSTYDPSLTQHSLQQRSLNQNIQTQERPPQARLYTQNLNNNQTPPTQQQIYAQQQPQQQHIAHQPTAQNPERHTQPTYAAPRRNSALDDFKGNHPYRRGQPYSIHTTQPTTTYGLSTGIRRDELRWNIGSNNPNPPTTAPNILSELTWEDVILTEIKGKLRHASPIAKGQRLIIDANLSAGMTLSGDNQDSDYNGNNRTLEFSRSNNESKDGLAFGADLSTGYEWNILSQPGHAGGTNITVMPMIGYSWDRQRYTMTKGHQTVTDDPITNPLGPFDGLKSYYQTTWQGPYIGLETALHKKRHSLTLRGQYHDLDYDARARWNLRGDFMQDPSYIHEADGDGYKISASYAYQFPKGVTMNIDLTHQERLAEDGLDTTYLSNGTVGTIPLHEVENTTQSLHVGLNYNW